MSDNTKRPNKPKKLPWYRGSGVGYGHLNGWQIRRDDGLVVAVTIGDVPELDAKAFAEFICRAVNSYDDMLSVLKDWLLVGAAPEDRLAIRKRAREAIAQAEGRTP